MNSCQQATYLISKKEEGKLTAGESLMLSVHLRICDLCRSFEKQTGLFAGINKQPLIVNQLSERVKERMKKDLQKLIDQKGN